MKKFKVTMIIVYILIIISFIGIFFILIFNFGGKKTTTAETYLDVNSIKRNIKEDTYMYTRTTKTKIEKSSSSSGSSSGGSSSGGGYGGGGRSF